MTEYALDHCGELMREALRFEPDVRAYLRNLFASAEQIEELLQELYGRVCALPIEAIAGLRTYLSSMVRELATEALSQATALDRPSSAIPTPSLGRRAPPLKLRARPAPDESQNDLQDLIDAVRTLPSQTRQIFTLRKVYGWNQQQIALHLNFSEHEVEQHLVAAARVCATALFSPSDTVSIAPQRRI